MTRRRSSTSESDAPGCVTAILFAAILVPLQAFIIWLCWDALAFLPHISYGAAILVSILAGVLFNRPSVSTS